MAFYGLDFGTTNSSISLFQNGQVKLFPIDTIAPDSTVIRSALYFAHRKFVPDRRVTSEQLQSNTFKADQFHYEGEIKNLIGASAVKAYLDDNKSREAGVRRKIYTGKIISNIPMYVTTGGTLIVGSAPEYYEEIDNGAGRLFHALKTALKSPMFKGNRVFGIYYELEQLIGLLLSQIKRRADQMGGEIIDSVVCGRPRYFSTDPVADKAAEDRLREAVRQAGFKKIEFEYEPVAAAKYYLSQHPEKQQKIFVFDFGGGTLDTSIMENDNGFKVIGTDGVYIGGDLLNSDIFYQKLGPVFGTEATWGDRQLGLPTNIVSALQSWFGIPNLNNPRDIGFIATEGRYKNSDPEAMDRLLHLIQKNLGFEIYEAIEIAKKQLSRSEEAVISFSDGPINLSVDISRQEFEKIIQPRVEEVRKTVLRTLNNAGIEPDEIDAVVRTGGSSLIPVFENMLVDIFGSGRVVEFDPFTSIGAGLCLPRL